MLNSAALSQSNKDSLKDKPTVLDLNFAAGNSNGIRVGARFYFHKRYSVEISYGTNPEVFGGGDGGPLYEVSLNIFPIENKSLICGLMGVYNYNKETNVSPYRSYAFSPYVGILLPRNSGIMFHSRGGFSLQFINYYKDAVTKTKFSIAFELGFAVSVL